MKKKQLDIDADDNIEEEIQQDKIKIQEELLNIERLKL